MTTSEDKDRVDAADVHQAPVTTMADVRKRYPGFVELHTGGGQMALRHDCDCGGYILIIGEAAHIPSDDATHVDIGRYGSRDDYLDGCSICLDEIVRWIDDALERSRNPTCVEDYFARKLGWSPEEEGLRELSLESPTAQTCVQAIDACAAVLTHVQTAIRDQHHQRWRTWFHSDDPEFSFIQIARGIVRAYRQCGGAGSSARTSL